MRLIVASSNAGKIREIKELMEGVETLPYTALIPAMEIEESEPTFWGNALLKAKAVDAALGGEEIVIADDSGISVPVLGGEPGIYSARYARIGATDRENCQKLIARLKERGISRTPAFYTAAIAIATPHGHFCVHGWMHGEVLDEMRGEKGFGYDPLFIPRGFSQTLGELEDEIKKKISHRSKALALARLQLRALGA